MKMMRNVDKFHLFQCLLLLGCLLCVPHSVQAQAWDGEGDIKVYAGYANVGGRSGMELGSDYALSDFISVGGQVTYVNVKKHSSEDYHFLVGYDFSLMGNYHWSEVLKLSSVLDIYTGASVGLRAAGLQAGVRYNFGETIGVYGQVRQNLFKTFGDDEDYGPVYQGKTAFSLGMTVTF